MEKVGANWDFKVKEAPWIRVYRDDNTNQRSDWHIHTPDGTHYVFTEQLNIWTCNKTTEQAKEHAKKFMVSEIIAAADASGQPAYSINFEYQREQRGIQLEYPCNNDEKQYYYQVRPTRITYNGTSASAEIEFGYESRSDYPRGCDDADCSNYRGVFLYYHTKALRRIDVRVNGQVIRRYDLVSETLELVDGSRVRLLDKIEVYDTDAAGAQPIAPGTEFSYNRTDSCHEAWESCLLDRIDNGQGGMVKAAYDHIYADSMYVNRITRLTWSDQPTGYSHIRKYEYGNYSNKPAGFDIVWDKETIGGVETSNRHEFIVADNSEGGWGKEKRTVRVLGTSPWMEADSLYWWDAAAELGSETEFVLRGEQHHRTYITPSETKMHWTTYVHYYHDPGLQGGTQYGNVTHIGYEIFDEQGGHYVRSIVRRYKPQTSDGRYIVDRMAEETLSGLNGCIQLTRYYHDGASDHNTPPTKGLLTKVERRDCSGQNPVVLVENSYDPTWNTLTRTQDGAGRGVTYQYDSTFHALVTSETNDLGHVTVMDYNDPQRSCFNLAFGLPYQVTDANGQVTTYQYDSLGRLTAVDRPLGANSNDTVTEYVDYNSSMQEPRHVISKQCARLNADGSCQDYLTSWTFYDGLGRRIQQQTESEEAGKRIVVNWKYEEGGKQVKESIPYEVNAPVSGAYIQPDWDQPFTTYEYDRINRVKRVHHPNGDAVVTEYNHLYTAVFDEKGHLTVQKDDGLGRIVHVTTYETAYDTGGSSWVVPFWRNLPSETPYTETEYEYDARDGLTDVWNLTNGDPVHTSIEYDHAGRKWRMDDPDMGTWYYEYDAASNLKRQTDPRNNTLCFYYDALNRLTHKVLHYSTSCPSEAPPDYYPSGYNYDLLARFYYDGDYPANQWINGWRWPTWTDVPAPTGFVVGRLTAELWMSANPDNWRVYHYDARGRIIKEDVLIGQGDMFTTQYGYNPLDRVRQMIYPDGEVLTYEYNAQGLPERLTSSTGGTYVDSMDYDALGRVVERVLGSGTYRTRYTYYDWEIPDGNAGRLEKVETGTAGTPNSLQGLTYTYDRVGNVASLVDDQNSNQKQCFQYDHLNRLTQAFTGNTDCTAYEGSQGSGVYDRSYQFSGDDGKLGNVTGMNSLSYGYLDADHRHALTHVNGVEKYKYDAAGNMYERDGASLSYDIQNRLRSIWENGQPKGEFTYDSYGALMYEYIPATNSSRRYIGEHYEWAVYGTYKKYYLIGGVRVAFTDVVNQQPTLYWLLQDHLGSTAVTAKTDGSVEGEVWYYPYGEQRDGQGDPRTTYLFTGQRQHPASGLYWYRSRWYDPVIGRFLQPDPIVPEPGNPQALNRYAYVYNNPLRYTDPSGYCIPGVNCPGDVSGIEHPPDPSGLRGEAYAAWLTHYILWQEQQRAETGGMLDIELGQRAAAFELSCFLMKDPQLLKDILYQEVMAAAPQLSAQAAWAATDVLISNAGWALGMVRQAWQQAKTFPRFRDLPTQPGLERHHLIERRFADVLGVKPGDLPADYVAPQEHRGPRSITSELRQRLPYGAEHAPEAIWEAHREVYAEKGRFDWIEAIDPYFEALRVKR